MKKYFLALCALGIQSFAVGFPNLAEAAVVDQFECEVTVFEHNSNKVSEAMIGIGIGRRPLNRSPRPDVRMTAGASGARILVSRGDKIVQAGMHLYYEHAMVVDAVGNIKEARQSTCLNFYASMCKTIENCGVASATCANHQDPFDPVMGWPIVRVVDNIPTFDQSGFGVRSVPVIDEKGQERGIARLKCSYKGSID